jgi:23S rRNA (uracil1939-C5)-methyltransferase
MHELTLEALAFGGDAVGHLGGRVVFVPFGAPGDRVRVRLVKQTVSYARGEILELCAPGPSRRSPPCPHAGHCGGCQWQHLVYPAQVDAKQDFFIHAMAEAGVDSVEAVHPAPRELHYRRRVRLQLHIPSGGRPALGYYRWRSRELVDVDRCPLLEEGLEHGLAAVRRALGDLHSADTVSGSVSLLLGESGVHASLRLDAGHASSSELERLLRRLLVGEHALAGAAVSAGGQAQSGGRASVELDGEAGQLAGAAGAFAQANAEQDRALRSLVRALARAEGLRALELHAGIGNLTQVLARDARELTAVESSASAAELLRANATVASGSCPVTIRQERAERACAELAARGERFDLALLDPPREGCPELPALLARLGVARVVYVSCDPMTLARDLTLFAREGLRPTSARALDMMPQSFHLEVVALLER